MSVHDWDQWKKIIQIGFEIGLIQKPHQPGEVGEWKINLSQKILDGMMC
jgi:hypothetical protein